MGCIISFWMCHQQLKTADIASFELVADGQYPIKISMPSSAKSFQYFKVQDKQQQKVYPAQRMDDSTVVFLAKNSSFKITPDIQVIPSNNSLFNNEIIIKKSAGALLVTKNNKPILNYQIAEQLPVGISEHYKRGGFIHPLYSPNGKILTDDFPEGHTHQHAVFFAFCKYHI